MKKETIFTAIVFFSVGFLAGYIYNAQKSWNAQDRPAASGGPPTRGEIPGGAAVSTNPGGTPQELPEGHPPIDTTAIIKTLEEQAAKNPKDPEPRLKLANFLYDQHQFQQAIEWYQRALELDPKNVNARTDLGTSYFSMGRTQDALREYRKSLEINPKHEPTLFNIVVVNLEGTHDFRAAQQAWDRLHRQNPSYPGLDRLKQSLDATRASGLGAATRR